MRSPSDATFQTLYRELLLEFLAELFTATCTSETPAAFQRAVQTFCEELHPWLTPADVPSAPRVVFALFADCTINEETDLTTVRLSPEGEAFSQAWVRRHAVLTEAAGHTAPGRSH